MPRTRSGRFLVLIGLLVGLAVLAAGHAAHRRAGAEARLAADRALAGWFVFTDLSLFTDARYTRHPSLADRHSPFQDHPLALEHFPSGALVPPPRHLVAAPGAGPAPARRPGP
jgi:hypothetical protein